MGVFLRFLAKMALNGEKYVIFYVIGVNYRRIQKPKRIWENR